MSARSATHTTFAIERGLRRLARARVRRVGHVDAKGPMVWPGRRSRARSRLPRGRPRALRGGVRRRCLHLRRAIRRHRSGRAHRLHVQHAPRRGADVGLGDDGRARCRRPPARACATRSRASSWTARTSRSCANRGRRSSSTSSASHSHRGLLPHEHGHHHDRRSNDVPRAHRGQASDRARWLAVYVLCVGMLMIVLDATIVNVALPSIQQDLHFSTGEPGVGRQRLPDRVRRPAASGWTAGRPVRPPADVSRGRRVFTSASLLCGVAQAAR